MQCVAFCLKKRAANCIGQSQRQTCWRGLCASRGSAVAAIRPPTRPPAVVRQSVCPISLSPVSRPVGRSARPPADWIGSVITITAAAIRRTIRADGSERRGLPSVAAAAATARRSPFRRDRCTGSNGPLVGAAAACSPAPEILELQNHDGTRMPAYVYEIKLHTRQTNS